MSKSDYFENAMLKILFNATAIANICDNASSGALTNLYLALHTLSPGEGGNQLTNEAAYTSYGRVAVARSTGGWPAPTVGSVSPAANIDFPTATGGSETENYASIGATTTGGGGVIYYYGPITPAIPVVSGVTPRLTTASVITED